MWNAKNEENEKLKIVIEPKSYFDFTKHSKVAYILPSLAPTLQVVESLPAVEETVVKEVETKEEASEEQVKLTPAERMAKARAAKKDK